MLSEHRINYLLVFLLLALSGIPFFYKDPLMTPVLFMTFIFTSFLFINRKYQIDNFILVYIYIFFIISLGQFFIFDAMPVITVAGYIIRILLAYLIVKITGRAFISYYVNILYFLCIISFCFYFPTLVNPKFESFCINNITTFFDLPQAADAYYKITPNLIVFNFNSTLGNSQSFGIRNSGPFWEPGAFGGFTIIALIFNLIKTRALLNKRNAVFIMAILTTLSTSVIIALFILLILYYIQLSTSPSRFLLVPAMIIISLFCYYQLDFLGKKINASTSSITTGNTTNRFVSGLTDLKDIEEFWLLGRGMNENTKFDDASSLDDSDKHRNNGVTAILVNIGLICGLFYFSLITKSFRALCDQVQFPKIFVFSIVLVILIIGFSEGYFTKVFFISLTMLHIVFIDNSTKKVLLKTA